jgi:uncharacterized protein with GYD domain
MAVFLGSASWTDQGIKTVGDAGHRYDAFTVGTHGGKVHSVFVTMGAYNLGVTDELPSDEAATQIALSLGAGANIRTVTRTAFPEDDYKRLTAGI